MSYASIAQYFFFFFKLSFFEVKGFFILFFFHINIKKISAQHILMSHSYRRKKRGFEHCYCYWVVIDISTLLSFLYFHSSNTSMHFPTNESIEWNGFILVNQSYSHRKQEEEKKNGFSNVISLENKCMLKHQLGNPIDIWNFAVYTLASWTRTHLLVAMQFWVTYAHIQHSKYS